jgi:hypothetical protein
MLDVDLLRFNCVAIQESWHIGEPDRPRWIAVFDIVEPGGAIEHRHWCTVWEGISIEEATEEMKAELLGRMLMKTGR